VLNGMLWASVIRLRCHCLVPGVGRSGDHRRAICINLLCAALAGLSIPMILKRFRVSTPGLAGAGVFV